MLSALLASLSTCAATIDQPTAFILFVLPHVVLSFCVVVAVLGEWPRVELSIRVVVAVLGSLTGRSPSGACSAHLQCTLPSSPCPSTARLS